MATFDLTGVGSYARASASQSDLGTATTFGIKIRVRGEILTSTPDGTFDYGKVLTIGDGVSTIRLEVELRDQAAVGVTQIAVRNPGNDNFTFNFNRADIVDGDWYVLYIEYNGGDDGIWCFRADGTLEFDGTAGYAAGAVSNAATGNGIVSLGNCAEDGKDAALGLIDGVAIYSDVLTGADRWSPPAAGDPSILFFVPFDEGSGASAANEVAGAEALDDLNGAWTAGGSWDGAASGETGAITEGADLDAAFDATMARLGAVSPGVDVDATFDTIMARLGSLTAGAQLGHTHGTAVSTFFDDFDAVLGASFAGLAERLASVGADADLSATFSALVAGAERTIQASASVDATFGGLAALLAGLGADAELGATVAAQRARAGDGAEDAVLDASFAALAALTVQTSGGVSLGASFTASILYLGPDPHNVVYVVPRNWLVEL